MGVFQFQRSRRSSPSSAGRASGRIEARSRVARLTRARNPPCDSANMISGLAGCMTVKNPSPPPTLYQSRARMPWLERVLEGAHHEPLSWRPPQTW